MTTPKKISWLKISPSLHKYIASRLCVRQRQGHEIWHKTAAIKQMHFPTKGQSVM